MVRYRWFFWPLLCLIPAPLLANGVVRSSLDGNTGRATVAVFSVQLVDTTVTRGSDGSVSEHWLGPLLRFVVMLGVAGMGLLIAWGVGRWQARKPSAAERFPRWLDAATLGALCGFLVGAVLVRGIGLGGGYEDTLNRPAAFPDGTELYQVRFAGFVVSQERLQPADWPGWFRRWQLILAGGAAAVGALAACGVLAASKRLG
jgi:hypothetical protein